MLRRGESVMKITPVDVAHKTFNKSVYGLDQKEVLSYLQAVADQLEILIKERNDLREKIREKEIQISEFKERDQLLKNTLTTASQMSEKIREDADKKAELILQEAHMKANDIQKGMHESLRKAYAEINDLKALRIQFETNMKALAHAHLALLDEGQKYMGIPTTDHGRNEEVISSKLSNEISPLSAEII
jgi:cell division initiation protein